MPFSQTQFQNAHHLEFNGGQFFNMAHSNATIINSGSSTDPVSTALWHHVAAGAIFDSAERYPPGKCHPGTRERVIERIMAWIDDPDPPQRILWVYGPAGCGKSALAHTICELLRQADADKCGGTFFFARGLTDRGKGVKLFVTLSYQLAVQFPGMRAEINEALSRDPSLPTKSMEVQLFYLIVQPLLRCRPFPSHSPTLIIDGLDECADDQGIDTQRIIINLISESIVKYNIPLRFIVASRPESWIRDTFETSPLPNIALSLSLRDDEDADDDIRAYLTDEFEKIRMENHRIMGSVVPPWPPANIVDRFVYEASGQYIYASTLLRFVGKSSRFDDPQEQLRILISPGPHRALAFSELDRLYERIVSAHPRWATMKRVLGGILVNANTTIIEVILGVGSTELILILDALSPLIDIVRPEPLSGHELLLEPIFGSLSTGRDIITFCHLSFREFLEDEMRSGPFHIDLSEIEDEINRGFFGIIHRNLEGNYNTEPHISLNIGLAAYQNMMFTMAYRVMVVGSTKIDILLSLIDGTTQRLLLLNSREMKHWGCFKRDMEDISYLVSHLAKLQSEPNNAAAVIGALTRFNDISSLTWKKGIEFLSLGNNFMVTPALAYLCEFNSTRSIPINELFAIPWHTVADVLSTFQQHRHIIYFHYRHSHKACQWEIGAQVLGDEMYHYGSGLATEDPGGSQEGWRTRGEWKNQRVLLAYRYLSLILNKGPQADQKTSYGFLGRFFLSRSLSDIYNMKYFQNPCNLSILALVTDLEAWTRLSPLRSESWVDAVNFIIPVLRWFDRQLKNTESLKLLYDRDKGLVQKMKIAMEEIFEHHFLPGFRDPYHSELYVSTFESGFSETDRSIKIKVFPLPQNHYQEEAIPYIPRGDVYPDFWVPFHDQVFRTEIPTEDGPIPSTIDPLRWHPYLASHLLNSLAKLLYTKVVPGFVMFRWEGISEESFAYIVECLPYAETTQLNLDSLRGIVYFFPNANLGWDLPADFWSLSVEFLKKYDRSILSEEEFGIFEQWMQ